MKCREYKEYSVLCQSCDIKTRIRCSKKINFDEPKEIIKIKKENGEFKSICPTCGEKIKCSSKCTNCGQLLIEKKWRK